MYRRTWLAVPFALALATGTWAAQESPPPGLDAGQSETVLDTGGLSGQACQIGAGWLIGSQGLLFIVVFIGLPLFSRCKYNALIEGKEPPTPLTALNLPQGSVRSMLALAIVGTFLNVLAFGGCILGMNFNSVLAAFGTLTGSVLGFYFGSRKSS